MNSIGRFSTGIANIAFTKMVTVPAGQTVKLPIKINVNNNAGVASELKISLLEVKSDTALAGNFPMVGNAFTIAAVDLGTIDVKKSGDAPVASVNAGDKNVRLAKFDFEVGFEAQTIKRIVFSQDGTAADADLANLKLVDEDGTTLALGEMNKGELAFDLNKDCISGTTARLTVRGDVVGGAGRTIQFSVDNVNDVQSIGKVYETTIVASGTAYGNPIDIDRGAFILTKATSSPASSTIATTVDDYKFAAIKVEAMGEPIQLETITVALDTKDEVRDKKTNRIIPEETAIREVKLVNGGVVVASQEIKKNDLKKNDNGIAEVELALSEVVTIEPHAPTTVDILLDLKDAAKDAEYTVGISKITGTGLVSGKDVTIPAKIDTYDEDGELIDSEYEDDDITYGGLMTVGDVKITIEQKAQVDGYVFKNQSEETFAQFNVKHNLGERVRLSSITFRIDKVAYLDDNNGRKDIPEVPNDVNARTATSTDILRTFKGFHVVSSDGKTISDTVNPTSGVVKISLDEGVIVEPGKTLKLGLVGDIRSNATEGDVFEIYSTKAAAVTLETGTRVTVEPSTFSREITITSGANSDDVNAAASLEKTLKNQNVLAEQKNVEIARWTISNDGKEDIGINKIYLTAHYSKADENVGKELTPASIQFMLKDGKGTVVSDWDDLKGRIKGTQIDSETEIKMLRDNNKSKFIVPAAKNGESGKTDLVLYANIEENAPIAGTISVALGKEINATTTNESGTVGYSKEASGDIHFGPDKEYKAITLFEMTGTVSGVTQVVTQYYVDGVDGQGTEGQDGYVAPEKYTMPKLIPGGEVIEGEEHGPTSTVAISKVIARSAVSSDSTLEYKNSSTGNPREKVAEFYIKNNGPKQVSLKQVAFNIDEGSGVNSFELLKNDEVKLGENGTVEANKITFELTKGELRIGANEEVRFTVRTAAENNLKPGKTVHLTLDKNKTQTDTAAFDGYSIGLDNENNVDLKSVTVKNASN